MSVKYGTNVRKFSVVGKRRTMSSTTIDNSFKEAYFTPQCVYIDDCELPEITRSRRDTPIYNRLNVESEFGSCYNDFNSKSGQIASKKTIDSCNVLCSSTLKYMYLKSI